MNSGAHKADVRIAIKNALKIQAALRQGIDAKRVIAAYRRTNPHTSKNPTQDRARARSWALLNMRINNEPLLEILQRSWADAFVLGQAYGDEQIMRAREAKKAAQDYVDWDNWKPGDAATATLIRPPKAFQELLGRARVTIKDLDQTGYDRVGTALADSIEQGLSDTRAARLINDAIGSPARALSIAITETNRAMSYGAISRYKEAHLEQMEWETSDPCPTCAMNSGAKVNIGGTFPSGAEMPPAHPHCRCALLPVIPEFEANEHGVVDIAPKPEPQAESYRRFTDKEQSKEFQAYQLQDKTFMQTAYKQGGQKTEEYIQLSDYKDYGYGRVNHYLRTGKAVSTAERLGYGSTDVPKIDDLKYTIKTLDKALKAAPGLPEPIITHRVIGSFSEMDNLLGGLKPGDIWIDKGYSSTTLNKDFLDVFSTGWKVEIENPKGTKGIMLDALKSKEGYANSEDEWLLPRGTNFEILETDVQNKTMRMRVSK
jgi:SPP1 gp7 family putative phage head morphogenesis protein